MSKPADRLKQARIAMGFATASDAARTFGWSPSTYLGHENGSRGLKLDAAERYGRDLRVSAAWLLTGDRRGHEASIPIVGHVLPGAWRSKEDANPGATSFLPVGVPGFKKEELFAVRIDDGMEDLKGRLFAICVYVNTEVSLYPGDEVVICVKRDELWELNVWTKTHDQSVVRVYGSDRTAVKFDESIGSGSQMWGTVVADYRLRVRSLPQTLRAEGFEMEDQIRVPDDFKPPYA